MRLHVGVELIRKAQTEGGTALESVIASVWDEAYRICATMLRDRVAAEDAAQDACVAILQGFEQLRDAGAFPAWSYKIIVNRAISIARRRSNAVPIEAVAARQVHFDTDDALDLATALAALPITHRGAIVLHYYAGLTSREIAEATGLPRSTVRFHLMLARRSLRAALSPDYVDPRSNPSHEEVYIDAH